MKNYKSLIIAILISYNFTAPLFSSAEVNYDEGWRWRYSLDFTYEHNGKEYSTSKIEGKEKIKIIFGDEVFESVQLVHYSLANTVSELDKKLKASAEGKSSKGKGADTNTNQQAGGSSGKKQERLPGNYALAAVGSLCAEKPPGNSDHIDLTLYIEPLIQEGTKKRIIFTTGVSEAAIEEYIIGNYDYRKKDDLYKCYEFYKEHTDGFQFKKAFNWVKKIETYIKDNKAAISEAAPSTKNSLDADDILPNIGSLQTNLTNEVERRQQGLKQVNVKDLESFTKATLLVTEFQSMLAVLEKLIDALPETRFSDSEKYALVHLDDHLIKTKKTEKSGLLETTLHLHSNLAVCEHCSKTISWYFGLYKNVPFVSCWEPSSGLKEDKVVLRDGYGVDSGFHTLINLKSLKESLIYPQCRILHIKSSEVYPCKTPEELVLVKKKVAIQDNVGGATASK